MPPSTTAWAWCSRWPRRAWCCATRRRQPTPALAWADATRLRQVLLNLLSNAIKYNHPGGEVQAALAGRRWHGCVAGGRRHRPGLSRRTAAAAVPGLRTAGRRRSAVEGTGIGLALSRSLVDADGRPHRRAQRPARAACSGSGCRRPGPPAPADARRARRRPPAAASRQRDVLYIEDNPVNQMLMSAMLRPDEHRPARSRPCPRPGWDGHGTLPPDLVLLDIQLPGIDGFEVLRRLRADPRCSTRRWWPSAPTRCRPTWPPAAPPASTPT
jgi:hypothetical protein